MPTSKMYRGMSAKDVAQAVMTEANFPAKSTDHGVGTLFKKIDSRKGLSFQTKDGVAVVKGNEDSIYCYIDHSFYKAVLMDIDHMYSFDSISNNVNELLEFLNSNTEFAEEFLAAKGMAKFFVRDSDNTVCITGYARRLYYNDAGNLLPMNHGSNILKSAKDLVAFLSGISGYKQKFKKFLEQHGGLKEGVIIDKVRYQGEDIGLSQFLVQFNNTIHPDTLSSIKATKRQIDILEQLKLDALDGGKSEQRKLSRHTRALHTVTEALIDDAISSEDADSNSDEQRMFQDEMRLAILAARKNHNDRKRNRLVAAADLAPTEALSERGEKRKLDEAFPVIPVSENDEGYDSGVDADAEYDSDIDVDIEPDPKIVTQKRPRWMTSNLNQHSPSGNSDQHKDADSSDTATLTSSLR